MDQSRKVQDPIMKEILGLGLSRDLGEAILEHYRIGTALIDAIWAIGKGLSRIPRLLRMAARPLSPRLVLPCASLNASESTTEGNLDGARDSKRNRCKGE